MTRLWQALMLTVVLAWPGQAPRLVPPGPQTPAAQAPPDTEIYLASFTEDAKGVRIGAPTDITNNPDYDNQPFFTPDSREILFTSMRDGKQTDIYRYTLATKQTAQVTHTPESEYSPAITPAGLLSVVRVELDGHNTQRLWQFNLDGTEPSVVLKAVQPVGYYAWVDDHTVALYILGARSAPVPGNPGPEKARPDQTRQAQHATLQLADTRAGQSRVAATDIGRSIQRVPGTGPAPHVSFVQRKQVSDFTYWIVEQLDPRSGDVEPLAPPLRAEGPDMDTAWTPDGTLLTARGADLYAWHHGDQAWTPVASLERLGLHGVNRLAVSPDGKWIALVAEPQRTR